MGNGGRPILGIDLGTTHTVAAVCLTPEEGGQAVVLPITQPIDARTSDVRPLLPSVLFAALEGEAEGLRHQDDHRFLYGELARRRGAEIPTRLVASAKSWLGHGAVDRDAPLLPWGAEDDEGPRISPVDASARYLEVVRHVYEAKHGPAAEAEVVLTIPASFDDGARELTLLAARRAGLEVSLVEEPTAAFHDWLARRGDASLRELLSGDEHASVLVVDVGGGTTDLSLLQVRSSSGAPVVSRVAVSDHLLLGGDNMDLALAHRLEPAFSGLRDERLDRSRFGELCLAVRHAKELLLMPDSPREVAVTLLGRGSRLIGGARSVPLARGEVEEIVLDGFFPVVGAEARPLTARGGLRAVGLPYARDAAISRHLAAFFGRSDVAACVASGRLCVLPNGGVFRSELLVDRLIQVIAGLTSVRPRVLPERETDVAVARGAVAYALARRGRGTRIRSGSPRTYFLGLAASEGGPSRMLAVLPRGSEPGERHRVEVPVAVITGKRVRFDLYTSTEHAPAPGHLEDFVEGVHQRLPPLTALLEGQSGEAVPVALETELTEVGTLALACVERKSANPRRFSLEFQLRGEPSASPSLAPRRIAGSDAAAPLSHRPSSLSLPPLSVPPASRGLPSRAPSVLPPRRLDEARDLLQRAFGDRAATAKAASKQEPREAKELMRDLERLLADRATWDATLCRSLADLLLPLASGRKRSDAHERAFFALAGFVMRPGIGDDGDEARVQLLGAAAAESLGAQPKGRDAAHDGSRDVPRDAKGFQQIFIALRRIAAGLPEEAQTQLFTFAQPFAVDPRPRKKGPPNGADDELLSLVTFLYRVPKRARVMVGEALVERTYSAAAPRVWELVGRLGARRLPYGSAHLALDAKTVEPWVEDLLRESWDKLPTAKRALRELSLATGERSLDISPALRTRAIRRLVAEGADARTIALVTAPMEDEDDDDSRWGEALPSGLRLGET